MASRFLIVEDEPRLARAIVAILRAEGRGVCVCQGVAEALSVIEREPIEAAIMDINVQDGLVFPVADRLASRNIPYAFCSSMHVESVPTHHRQAPFLQKPFELDDLLGLADTLEARVAQSG